MNIPIRTTGPCLFLLLLMTAGNLAAGGQEVSGSLTEDRSTAKARSVAKELSVPPLDHVEYPESRPDWVTHATDDNLDSYRVVVVSGPCDTVEESLEQLRWMKRVSVANLANQIAQSDGELDFYAASDQEIDERLVTRTYAGEVMQGDLTRYEHAAEIEFSENDQQLVRQAWQAHQVRHRLGALGIVTFSGLALLICGSALTGVLSRRVKRRNE